MPMFNLNDCSDSYPDTSGRLWLFKRENLPASSADVTITNFTSFQCKSSLIGNTVEDGANSYVQLKIK